MEEENLDSSQNVHENTEIRQSKAPEKAEKTTIQNNVQTAVFEQKIKPPSLSSKEWFEKAGWTGNPFTFTILPELFVGYAEQTSRLLSAVEEKHKIILLIGPTGSGKTTTLKWMSAHLPPNY